MCLDPAREINICFMRRTALAEGVFFVLETSYFLPGELCVCSPCVFRDGHKASLCLFLALAEGRCSGFSGCSMEPSTVAEVTVTSDSLCALVLCQDPVQAWEQCGSGYSLLGATEWGVLSPDWVHLPGSVEETFCLLEASWPYRFHRSTQPRPSSELLTQWIWEACMLGPVTSS